MHRAPPAPDVACGSRKPRRPAGSTQQGPVVMSGIEPTRRGCSDGAIRRPGGRSLPGWRAGVARAGGRSSWRTRCGCGDKHSFGPQRRAVKRLNGLVAKVTQAPCVWAIAVGLSNLTLRGHRHPISRLVHSEKAIVADLLILVRPQVLANFQRRKFSDPSKRYH
jgi:hypothetical protein